MSGCSALSKPPHAQLSNGGADFGAGYVLAKPHEAYQVIGPELEVQGSSSLCVDRVEVQNAYQGEYLGASFADDPELRYEHLVVKPVPAGRLQRATSLQRRCLKPGEMDRSLYLVFRGVISPSGRIDARFWGVKVFYTVDGREGSMVFDEWFELTSDEDADGVTVPEGAPTITPVPISPIE